MSIHSKFKAFISSNPSYPPSTENLITLKYETNSWEDAIDAIYNNSYFVYPERFDTPDIEVLSKSPEWKDVVDDISVKMIEKAQYDEVIRFIIQECLLFHSFHESEENEQVDEFVYDYFYKMLVELLRKSSTFLASKATDSSPLGVLVLTQRDELDLDPSTATELRISKAELGKVMGLHGPVGGKSTRLLRLLGISNFSVVESLLVTPGVPGRKQHQVMVILLKAASSWASFQDVPCVLGRSKTSNIKKAFTESQYKTIRTMDSSDYCDEEDQEHIRDVFKEGWGQNSYFIFLSGQELSKNWDCYEAYYGQYP